MSQDKKNKWLFIVRRCGRIANRIVLFANVIAFAEEKGYRVVNFSFHSYAHYFEGTDDTLLCAYPTRKCPLNPLGIRSIVYTWIRQSRLLYQAAYMLSKLILSLGLSGRFLACIASKADREPILLSSPEILEKIDGAKIVLLSGWEFRDGKNTDKQAQKIRAFFVPVKKYRVPIETRMNEVRRDCDMLIGVHIRHGDYRYWMGGGYYYSLEQYARLMEGMQSIYPGKRVKFLICSDSDIKGGNFPGLTVLAGKGTPLEDLYSLALCDMIIGPPSTFSQWASFYGKVPLWHVTDPDQPVDIEKFTVSSIDGIPG